MAKERCVKKSFQDSLEDIKERMKEKRTKKLAKVATVNKALSTKVKIINNSSTTVKSFQANNKALALALEAEKSKSRQAQDLILHLKREHQRLMYEIFILRRKLNMQQGSSSSEAKLSSLKEIIAKVTHNLLETANLLGPAHALCSSDGSLTSSPASMEMKCTNPPVAAPELLTQTCEPATNTQKNFGRVLERTSVPGRKKQDETEKVKSGQRLSKARTSSSGQSRADLEEPEMEVERDNSFLKNVSIRRRASSLNVCIEESPMMKSLEEEQNLNSKCDISEEEIIVPAEECLRTSGSEDVIDMYADQSPSREEFIPFTNHSRISSSTPEPKPKQSQSVKGKTESHTGRERVRKGRADGQVQLKKPWEKSKPRARSKSRERGAGKPMASKDKMNSSLNSGDAYDFVCEESVHVTPFRQTKPGCDHEENEGPENDKSSSSSSSDEELNDSLYVPGKAKAKSRNVEQNKPSLPLRPRSKRNKDLQQQCAEKTENKSEQPKQDVTKGKKNTRSSYKGSMETKTKPNAANETTEGSKEMVSLPKCIKAKENPNLSIDDCAAQDALIHSTDRNIYEYEGTSANQRISLSDVTNLSGSTESKKHSFPFSDDRKRSIGCMRKRRCTVTVNYAEPSLSKKLRRGDPFTDTEFLLSPIFKNGEPKRKSLNRKSLARYNEAFVGCR
ncbi:shugoshin 1 [Leptodactylus fuscus]|uniref:shugoshin 1 n=1 Tax=Leptodactylus fuscus TaxID=238119 RepID=UPI003F4EEEAB